MSYWGIAWLLPLMPALKLACQRSTECQSHTDAVGGADGAPHDGGPESIYSHQRALKRLAAQYTTQLQEEGDYIVSVHMRAAFEDLLYENQVNLMLVGHQHSYGMLYHNAWPSSVTQG